MSVEQKDKIDAISKDRETGRIRLTISDHLDWSDRNHVLVLQEKINSYLSFIESGQIKEIYPDADSANLIIEVFLKYEPDDCGSDFLGQTQKLLKEAGYTFRATILADEKEGV